MLTSNVVCRWFYQVSEAYTLHRQTFYLAQDYFDRFMLTQTSIDKGMLQLIGITCLFIASKMEVRKDRASFLVSCIKTNTNPASVIGMETISCITLIIYFIFNLSGSLVQNTQHYIGIIFLSVPVFNVFDFTPFPCRKPLLQSSHRWPMWLQGLTTRTRFFKWS